MEKACKTCGEVRPLEDFHRSSASKDGRQGRCKECACRYGREWSRTHRHQANANAKRRRDERRGGPPKESKLIDRDGALTKVCCRCGEEKQLDSFYRHKYGSGGVRAECIRCSVRNAYEWGRVNNERFRVNQKRAALKKRYGLTPEQVDAMFASQRGGCAICKAPLVATNKHIDHCHQTQRVRGLLCRSCNTGLGMFEDDPKRLRAALKYLTAAKE